MSQHVEHLVGAEVPHSEALILWVLGYNLAIEIINFHEIRILKSKVTKKPCALGISILQVIQRDTSTLHTGQVWSVWVLLDAHNEYGVVHKIQKSRFDSFSLIFIEYQCFFGIPIISKAYPSLKTSYDEVTQYNYFWNLVEIAGKGQVVVDRVPSNGLGVGLIPLCEERWFKRWWWQIVDWWGWVLNSCCGWCIWAHLLIRWCPILGQSWCLSWNLRLIKPA